MEKDRSGYTAKGLSLGNRRNNNLGDVMATVIEILPDIAEMDENVGRGAMGGIASYVYELHWSLWVLAILQKG